MSNLRHRLPQLSLAHGFLAVSTCILLGLLVAGCGSSASASKATTGKLAAATASPTCPPVVPTKAVSGAVRAVSSGSFTVATTTGATATVHLTSSTHFTRQVTATTAAPGGWTGGRRKHRYVRSHRPTGSGYWNSELRVRQRNSWIWRIYRDPAHRHTVRSR